MADDLYAPVARFGFAVAARARKPGTGKIERFLLRAAASDRAVEAITANHLGFEASVDRTIQAAGWTIEEGETSGGLAGFEFDRRHGVIADFTERLISHPNKGTVLLMRYCVTVCSQDESVSSDEGPGEPSLVIWQQGARRSIPQHSKVWIRFSCIRYRSRRLDQLTLKEMRAFHDEARTLAVKIKSAILGPYKKALGDIVGDELASADPTVWLRTVFHIDSFTVSVLDETFPSAYRQLLLGDDLTDVPKKSRMRNSLDRLKDAFDSAADELLPIDDLGFARGVYWLDLDNNRASLVGVANNSLSDAETNSLVGDVRALKSAPSNVIGILSGSMLASAI